MRINALHAYKKKICAWNFLLLDYFPFEEYNYLKEKHYFFIHGDSNQAFQHQGRIQDFSQGGGRDIKSIFTPRGARFRFLTFGKTHIKNWSDQLSEPLRKRTIHFIFVPLSPSLAAALGPL